MKRLVDWLGERKKLNYALVGIYVIAVILLHDPMVSLSVNIMNRLSMAVYDKVVAVIAIVLLLLFSGIFIRNLVRFRAYAGFKIFLLILTLILIGIHSQVLFVLNIEIIHALQYGLLACILFPLSRSFGMTMFYATLISCIDELYQYQILYPERESYFDFNDVVMNELGIGLALLFLFCTSLKRGSGIFNPNFLRSKTFIFASLIFVLAVVARVCSLLVPYAGAIRPHTLLTLNESPEPQAFWQQFMDFDIYFHILSPLEGVLICTLLFLLYSLMDLPQKQAKKV